MSALIASAPDLSALQKDFKLTSAPDAGGMQWVEALPLAKDGQLSNVRVGFKAGQLAVLEILDGFGQRSVLTFSQLQTPAVLAADAFQFKPPAGADVMRQ